MSGQTEAEFWSEQWATLLGLASAVVNHADAMMNAMRGDLGLPKGSTREDAAPIIAERIDAWKAARNDLIRYAKAAEADLERAAGPAEPDGPICDRPTCVADGECGCPPAVASGDSHAATTAEPDQA